MKLPGNAGALSPRKLELFKQLLKGRERDTPRDSAIPARQVFSPAPQSSAQRRLWFQEQLRPGSSLFTVPARIRISVGVDPTTLAAALNALVRRHEALRTNFSVQDGEPVQVIAPARHVEVPVTDLSHLEPEQRESAMQPYIDEEARLPFSLEKGSLIRAHLIRLDTRDHVLLLTVHHIVADGWSLGVLFRELSEIYSAFTEGRPSTLPEPQIQYADYAVWQQQWLASSEAKEQLSYWSRELAGVPPLELPLDAPRSVANEFAGARQGLTLSRELSHELDALSRREGVTLFMTLLASWQVLLHRYSGQADFAIGIPIANRTRPETQELIGFFLNSLPIRANLEGDPPFRELLSRVCERSLAAYSHQEVPFEAILDNLQTARHPSRSPVFQVFFNVLNFADERLNRLAAIDGRSPTEDLAQFDITMYAGVHDGRIQIHWVYSSGLFQAETVARMLTQFQILLSGICADADSRVSALPLLTGEERARMAAHRNRVTPDSPFTYFSREEIEDSIARRFVEQSRAHPERPAVQSGGTTWSYAELDLRSDHIAQRILACVSAVEPCRVALLCGHNAWAIAAMLGVLKTGNAFVPLDALHPAERLRSILDDSQVSAIVADAAHSALAAQIAAGLPVLSADDNSERAAQLPREVSPEAIAYLLYTSGSSGQPKGVLQNNRNVLHHIRAYTNALHIGAGDRISLLASCAFDAAVMDIWGALLNGASLCMFDLRSHGWRAVADWIDHESISILHSTPTVFRQMMQCMEDDRVFASVRLVVLGGEEARDADLQSFRKCFKSHCILVNGMGPTESTLALQAIFEHGSSITASRSLPVGYPVEDTEVRLLNDDGKPVDLLGVGEIVIVSRHVALGYWRRAELTRSRFRPDPFDRQRRAYYTGDYGRLLADGTIEFVSRRDRQLKIRGQRVECGDIEASLLRDHSIAEAIVVVEQRSGDPMLISYVTPHRGFDIDIQALRSSLRRILPEYMVPSAIVVLPRLPLTANGKIDRSALPRVEGRMAMTRPTQARTPGESELSAIFCSVLEVDQVGVFDNFFDLGGNSLSAIRLVARVREAIQVELPLRAVFEMPTVAELATYVENLPRSDRSISLTRIARNGFSLERTDL